ncbi:MAG: GWxTD domain-containing protein [Bacteroidales bacterium]|nr:GWxTD domain-containing protein [Bacteroidales bacterium]
MRKTIVLIVFAVAFLASKGLSAQNAVALFSYSIFNNPMETPYVETYISFNAWHFKFVPTKDDKYQATIEMTVVANRNDSMVYAKRYNLQSPTSSTAENNMFSFLDVRRFALPNGIYDLQITMKDKNADTDPIEINQELVIYFPAEEPSLSSLQIVASAKPTVQENMISRNGYDFEPYVDNYVPKDIDLLNFYYEMYNVTKEIKENDTFLSVAYIEIEETGRKLTSTMRGKRLVSQPVISDYTTLDISQVPSANCNLVVELRNRNNETFAIKKYPFQRSKPNVQVSTDDLFAYEGTFVTDMSEKELDYYITTLYATASEKEKDFIYNEIKTASLEEKRAFFYKFWLSRSENPKNEWFKYRKLVEYANKNFSIGKVQGYMSDRGRVYLQYGPPKYVLDEKNKVSTRNFQSIGHIHYLPYQMWFYDYIPGDNPKRAFVFFDELRTGNYYLLHSNAKGEVQDMYWERRLSGNQLEENVQAEAGVQFERGY